MKKIVGTIAAAALVASAAFADISFGHFGRAIFAPVMYNDADASINSMETVSWLPAGGAARSGFAVHGSAEKIGFDVDFNADGGSVGNCDFARVWAKPFDMLTVTIGKTHDDTGRGNCGFGAFDSIRIGAGLNSIGEDITFTRFGNGNGGQAQGAIIKLTPVEGLWAVAAFNVKDGEKAENTFGNNAQYGIGYDIDGIGSVRAQYIGGANGVTQDGTVVPADQINAAFDLTAIDGMSFSVGAYIPLHLDMVASGTKPSGTPNWTLDPEKGLVNNNNAVEPVVKTQQIKLAATANVSLDALTLHGFVIGYLPNAIKTGEKVTTTVGGKVQIGVGADFAFGDNLSIVADARFETAKDNSMKTEGVDGEVVARDTTSNFAASAAIRKGFSNGWIQCGVMAASDNVKSGNDEVVRVNFAVPVTITTYF